MKESAGKKKGKGSTGHGNRYLARVLGEAAVGAARTDTFLGERYRRIARRRGAKKAIVAVGRSILVIIWHLLSDPDARYARPRPRLLRPPASTPNAASATTSASSKPSATKSPSNPPPDPQAYHHPGSAPLRRALPRAPLADFRISYSQASLSCMPSQIIGTDLGVCGRDGEIRTRDLLLPKQAR